MKTKKSFLSKKQEKIKYGDYSNDNFVIKIMKFILYLMGDIFYTIKHGSSFNEWGITFFCGEQGSGKTMAMTEYLERMRKKYPNCLIVTNYGYKHQTHEFTDWNDFFNIRNGEHGVIFAIDEIQNEFNNQKWKNFPEELLSEITQQRKQKVKIVCTSQVYEDVVIQLRRQAFFIVECMTFANRLTVTKCYKRRDYERALKSVDGTKKVRKVYTRWFVQNEYLRSLYDTERKIERLARTAFLDRDKRLV